jgi:tRNA nucleotidyltransferase (CCA-adding enzyme)
MYPQVELAAAALVDVTLVSVPASISVTDALITTRRRNALALVAGDAYILRDDLARAASLGVGGARALALARPLPVVDARARETVVRRHHAAGAPLVVVRDGRSVLGAVAPKLPALGPVALADRLGRRLPAPALSVLETVARVAADRGARAYLAGGVVRDALADRTLASPDLDVVVEGDGPGVARALADALEAPLVEHARFLTATVGPTSAGRVDVATARSERYEGRGALPRVMPSSIGQDLRRRDFTINAMAAELASGAFGLLDRHGGRADLAAGRLSILHPASFVEDPTRIFRAARYAVRLGLRPDAWTRRCQAWALSLAPYEGLSGARILAELERVHREPRPDRVLMRLGVSGAYRLLEPRYRFTRAARAAILELPASLAWAREHGLEVSGVELLLVVLLAGQPSDIAGAALRRLELAGEPLARVTRAMHGSADALRAVAKAGRPSDRARALRGLRPLELVWLWLEGKPGARAQVEWFCQAGSARASLRGHDVIALGVPAGPGVAAALDALRDACLDGEVSGRSAEEAFVRAWGRESAEHVFRKEP